MSNIVGENIKKLREEMGFNQIHIAAFLGVDQSMVSKIEKGERSLSSDMLEKLACLFGVPCSVLENDFIGSTGLSFAFRANDLTADDMEAISAINRIALNSEQMSALLEKEII